MPHDHSDTHSHAHPDLAGGDRRVVGAVVVNLALTLAQIIAGILSGSLAMIADAIHNLSDALSLIIAFVARRIARRPADEDMTFGYGRAEVVAAMINYTTLIVVALYLLAEGVERLFNPVAVEGWIVVAVAGLALLVDTVTALLIFGMARNSVNMRAAFLHNLADALGSVAVIVAGVLILLYDWRLIDPIVTLLIAGYILWHSWHGLKPVIRILMLASPDTPQASRLQNDMAQIAGIASVHHLHLWQMMEHEVSLEAHVVLDGQRPGAEVKSEIRAWLSAQHNIDHVVLETEHRTEACAAPRHQSRQP